MNFNIVIDTLAFKPFDISPALNILRDYRDAYYKYDEQLNKIAEENGQYVLPDTPEYAEYKAIRDKYNKDLYNVVSDFSRGMNVRNALAVRDILKRYYSEMLPMNKAIEAYNKDLDKMTALGADAIIGNRLRSIKDYYGGINPGIDARSIKAIQSTAANVVAGIDNALMQAPNQAGSIASLYFVIKQKGLEGADALNAILKANPQLRTLEGVESTSQLLNALDRVYKQYAFKEGTPENALIWENVVSGAITGILAPKYTIQGDHSYLNDALSYDLKQQQKEDRFKYVYDEDTGAIKGFNDAYLKGAHKLNSSSSSSSTDTEDIYEEIPDGGKFHATKTNFKEELTISTQKVPRNLVPEHIRAEYPEGTVFYRCLDKDGNTIGYKAIKMKRVKKSVSNRTTNSSATTGVLTDTGEGTLPNIEDADSPQ